MKKTILVLSTLLLLFSCNNDNESITNQIDGKWFMQSFSIFGPSNDDLSNEYILWDFDTENQVLNVTNYYTDINVIYNTGQYSFTHTNNQILINNGTHTIVFDYTIQNNKLVISDHPELDGPIITFNPKEIDCIDDPIVAYQWLADMKFVFEVNQSAVGEQIIQYLYNDECVYLTGTEECCDNLIKVYNTQGEVICEFGGIAGINTCPDFFDIVTNKRFLYNDIED